MPTETLLSQFRHAQSFRDDQIMVDHHIDGKPIELSIYLNSKPYFKGKELPENLPNLLAPEEPQAIGFYGLLFKEIQEVVRSRITPAQEIADLSLSLIFEDSFNRHGMDHVSSVADNSIRLLKSFGINDKATHVRALITGLGHDLGTLESRQIHSILSPDLLIKLIPELKQDPLEWRKIRKAIYLHNPPVFEEYLNGISAEIIRKTGSYTPYEIEDQLIQQIRSSQSPEVFSTIIADTTDIRTARASDRADLTTDALDRNRHLALTFNTHPMHIGRDTKDQNTFTWAVEFIDTFPKNTLSGHYSQYSDQNRPGGMHISKLYSQFGDGDVFDGWFRGFVNTHGARFRHVALSAFVLDPELERFTFTAGYQEREISVVIERPDIAKKSISEQLEEIYHTHKLSNFGNSQEPTLSLN